jgi:hypothetical protein
MAGLLRRAGARLAAPLVGTPAELPDDLRARFPELAEVRWRRGGVFVRVGGWALLQPTVAAITLWRTVFLAPGVPWDAALLLHELRHVHHFTGSRAFPVRYLWESVRRGYANNWYEADANAYARARLCPGSAGAGAHAPQHSAQDV